MRKTVAGIMLAIVLTGQAQTPVQASTIEVKEEQYVAYRVYVDNEALGVISSKEAYDTFLETKMRTLLKENPGQVVQEPTNVTIQEELVLLPVASVNDEAVLKLVEDKADFKTSTNIVSVGDGKYSFITANTDEVYQTVIDLMALHSSEADVKRLSDKSKEIKPLEDDGKQYIGIKTTDAFKVSTGVAAANEVLTAQQVRSFILYGKTEPKETVIFSEGSSLSQIAHDFDLTEKELVLLNPGVNDLKWSELLGLELDVTPLNPITSVVSEVETVNIETIEYETEYVDDDSILKGETEVKQEGEEGEQFTRKVTTYTDGVKGKTVVLEDEEVSKPVNEIIARGTKVVVAPTPTPSAPSTPSTGGSTSGSSSSSSSSGSVSVGSRGWTWPTTSRNVTCGYLCYGGHYGIDINASVGQPVFAANSGVVVSTGYDGGYGNAIVIDHKNGYYTRYAHLSTINVSTGQSVSAGQTIGGAGSTGNSSGPHLHFEIRTNLGWQPSYAPNPLDFY